VHDFIANSDRLLKLLSSFVAVRQKTAVRYNTGNDGTTSDPLDLVGTETIPSVRLTFQACKRHRCMPG